MRVKYKFLSAPISFENNLIKVLVIENQIIYRNTIIQLYEDNIDEWFILSKDYKPVEFSKNIKFIDNILSFSMNDKKLMSKINLDLEQFANSNYLENLQRIKGELLELSLNLSAELDFNVEYSGNIETSSIIKLMSFRPRDDCEYPLERLTRYLVLLNNYLGISLFITNNLYFYFSDKDVNTLFETLSFHHIKLIDIEGMDSFNRSDLSEVLIVDKDLCEIVDN